MNTVAESIWSIDTGLPGPSVGISFGVHGNERPPIDAGLELVSRAERGELELTRGKLLLFLANPKASAEDQRWSAGGVDLNRCFHSSVLAREPRLYEEARAREIVAALEASETEALVDFHCTVEPGPRFLMQHPSVEEAEHARVRRFLRAEVLLSDPRLEFGGVSLDEWMSTRDRVGICYETGWIGDPANTPETVLEEMTNLLAGTGVARAGEARTWDGKDLLEMDRALPCEETGFAWAEGVGSNLQSLAAGTVLGRYASGREVVLERDAALVFPKKRPELVETGKPLVYLAIPR